MKCRVCGYELGDDRSYCPMCGTKVYQETKTSSVSNTEIAWNTKDFPKPKQLEDIDMNWGSGFKSFMAQDASEGFVSVEKKEEKPARPAVDPFELPSQMKQSAQSAYNPNPAAQPSAFDTWKMPQQQPEPQMPLWYTQNFTATGVMKTGPAYPIAQNVPAQNPMPNMQTPNAEAAAAALSAAMPDATIQFMKVDAPKPVYQTEPAYKTDYEAYRPDYDKVPTQAAKAPEKFNTFMAKNAEFQALLDKEYERIHARRAGEVSPIPSARTSELFTAETRVQAQSIDDFEKSLFSENKENDKKEDFDKTIVAQPVKAFSYDSDETDINLDELISDPLDPKFNINTIEMTIKQLEEEAKEEEIERQQKLSRLEAMKAAREAYFKFLDEDGDGKIDEPKVPEDATVIESVSDDDMKTWPSKEERENTQEMSDDFIADDVTKLPDELVGLYKDDDDEEEFEEEQRRKHGFLRFLFVLVVIVALFEGAVFGLQHFLPEAQITAQASAVQTAVVDALTNLYNKIAGLEF